MRFSVHHLRCAALLTLLLPAALFLITWVRPVIALPCVLALAAAFFFYAKSRRDALELDAFMQDGDSFTLPVLALLAVIACAVLWTFLSGIGGYFYQNEDHYGRNAIFHDLVRYSWPVYFPDTPFALTYYVAYWIIPALAGKAAGALFGAGACWPAANAVLFLQTVWFLVLVFLLMLSMVRARKLLPVCLSLLVFVLFSGMDALMGSFRPEAWRHQIEWWAETYQFSSNTTCLFWVYNQAVPCWLAVMLLLSRPWDTGSYALIGLAMLPFSPLPFFGLFFYLIGLFLVKTVFVCRENGVRAGLARSLRSCLTARNLLACAGIVPAFSLYFMANAASSAAPLRMDFFAGTYGMGLALLRLLLFVLIEFGMFSLVMSRRFFRDPLFLLTQLSLVLAPMFRIGYNMDFAMRASLPGLLVMTVYSIRFLLEALPESHGPCRHSHRLEAALLACLLLVGSITPMKEFERGLYKVKTAGTIFLPADPFLTVLHPDADTDNFICRDIEASPFYRLMAQPKKGN